MDIKPANMEDLTEVITAAEFHPHHCNLFVYSSSKGTLRLCDMRESALCDKHSKREHASSFSPLHSLRISDVDPVSVHSLALCLHSGPSSTSECRTSELAGLHGPENTIVVQVLDHPELG